MSFFAPHSVQDDMDEVLRRLDAIEKTLAEIKNTVVNNCDHEFTRWSAGVRWCLLCDLHENCAHYEFGWDNLCKVCHVRRENSS